MIYSAPSLADQLYVKLYQLNLEDRFIFVQVEGER